jgi:hypothetical protein
VLSLLTIAADAPALSIATASRSRKLADGSNLSAPGLSTSSALDRQFGYGAFGIGSHGYFAKSMIASPSKKTILRPRASLPSRIVRR